MRVRDSICAQNYTLTNFKNEQYPRDFEIMKSEDYTEQKFFGNLKRRNDVDSSKILILLSILCEYENG